MNDASTVLWLTTELWGKHHWIETIRPADSVLLTVW